LCIRKKGSLWLWMARSRKTGQIIAAIIGDRSRAMLEELWAMVPDSYRKKLVYTDDYAVYRSFFSAWQHRITDKTDGRTSRMEGINTLFRARVSGLVRKCCGVCAWINERVDDVWQRFLIVCHEHNERCKRRWRDEQEPITSTQESP
jgi:IS1 family transposase